MSGVSPSRRSAGKGLLIAALAGSLAGLPPARANVADAQRVYGAQGACRDQGMASVFRRPTGGSLPSLSLTSPRPAPQARRWSVPPGIALALASFSDGSDIPFASPSLAARRKWKRPPLGIDYDIYLPSSSRTRSRFGNVWGGIGLGIGGIGSVKRTGQFGPDIHVLHSSSGNGYIWLIPVGVSYQRAFTRRGTFFTPFVGGSLNVDFVKMRSDMDRLSTAYYIAGGGSLMAGINVSRNAYVRARYTSVSPVEGIDLSGVSLSAGFRY